MFTRQHYEAIAEVMLDSRPVQGANTFEEYCEAHNTWYSTLHSLCVLFETDNANFSKSKFLKFCGYDENKEW